jgi:hypothetical protein
MIIQFILHAVAWFVGLAVLMSFIEHQVHRRFMHRLNPLNKQIKALKKVFEHHAVLHHGYYHKIFSDEPVPPGQDRGLRLSLKEGLIEAVPFSAVIAFFSVPGALIFFVVVLLHHFLWNKIHVEMHKPQDRFFSNWPVYKFLARHHYLHHRYPDKNFNVVLPIADYVLGTNARPNSADWQGMRELGLLSTTAGPLKPQDNRS